MESVKITDKRFALCLTALFFLLALIGIAHHEMWRDETEAWMVARDAESFSGLLANMRYQGHPILWHIGLYIISRFTHNAWWMQLYHIGLASGIVYIFSAMAPFRRLHKVFFAFGYFTFFEYALISRNYAIGILFLFLALAFHERNKVFVAVLLGLMANCNVYAFIIASSLAGCIFVLPLFTGIGLRIWSRVLILPTLIFAAFALCSLIQIIPPSDSSVMAYHLKWVWGDAGKAFESIFASTLAIPRLFKLHYWGTILFYDPLTFYILSLLIMVAVPVFMLKEGRSRWFFVGGTLAILIFTYIFYPYASRRHTGHFFFILMGALWLSRTAFRELKPSKTEDYFLTGMLGLQLIGGIGSYCLDLIYPFSASVEMTAYIRANHLQDSVLIAYPDFTASTLSSYLDRPIYYPERKRDGTFMVWSKETAYGLSDQQLNSRTESYLQSKKTKTAWLFVNHFTYKQVSTNPFWQELKASKECIVEDERLFVFRYVGNKPKNDKNNY